VSEPLASTTTGAVRGLRRDGICQFRGIPFAAPPIGPRRFRPPQPPEPWCGTRDATEFGPAAPQRPGLLNQIGPAGTSEDCLTLNVYTPAPDDAGRPVMVWIHGGGFVTGSGSLAWYDGTSFARRGDVVVVTLNYRLGALGFLHLADLGGPEFGASGVNGLADQIAALRWVRDNIAGFGGDPGRVTVFGESAGGMSVATLLAMPAARGLFVRAIAQSGAAANTFPPQVAAEVTGAFLAALGVTDLEGVLTAPTEALLEAQDNVVSRLMADPGHVSGMGGLALAMPFQPVVDGVALPTEPLEAVRAGSAAEVGLITGWTLDEWNLFHLMSPGGLDDPRLLARLDRMVGDAVRGGGRTIAETYRAARPDADADEVWCAVLTDWIFRLPALRLAEAQHRHQPAHTFVYRFSWRSRGFDGRLGACHALDVPFVWNTLDRPGTELFLGEGPPPVALAEAVHDAWWHFARDGDPNHDRLPTWPAYDLVTRPTMDFGERVEVVHDPGSAERVLWGELR